MSPQITPFIWFDADPHEVRDFYAGVFDDFETLSEMLGPDGSVIGVAVSMGLSTTSSTAVPVSRTQRPSR
jgi:predicted 3-demethylubiquinone-9 3-methyltransferase (glyoxalase superfamily)